MVLRLSVLLYRVCVFPLLMIYNFLKFSVSVFFFFFCQAVLCLKIRYVRGERKKKRKSNSEF